MLNRIQHLRKQWNGGRNKKRQKKKVRFQAALGRQNFLNLLNNCQAIEHKTSLDLEGKHSKSKKKPIWDQSSMQLRTSS